MTLRYDLVLGTIPASAGILTFVTDISANNSTFLPVKVVVRSAAPLPTPLATPRISPP